MNILIPHKWLLEHLKTKAKPTQIQEYLSLSGPSVENIQEIKGDDTYDIEITTNRPDSLSVRGVAREAAVILSRYNLPSELKELKLNDDIKLETDELALPKINNNQAHCQRIMCVVLDKVKNKTTPKWMAERLEQAGFQTHGSIIDITNYVTHDLGHPCHAFDYDKIMELGGVINVEEARANQSFVTLDGESRETVGGEIIFTNSVGTIIDLPAIIGTANSSVDKNTKRVLLWLEDLDNNKVRYASMAHAIRTIAAQLNEKELDPYLGKKTLLRAIGLYQEVTNAKVASKIYDQFAEPPALKPIKLNYKKLVSYLGFEIEIDQITQILQELGCEVKLNIKTKKNQETLFIITPPSFRRDLLIEVDIIEEIARIYGYQNIPSKLMEGPLPLNHPENNRFELEEKIRQFLANIGWQELYSVSLIGDELVKQSGLEQEDHLELKNPLLAENKYLRRSLIPSINEAVSQNSQVDQLSMFELAAVYLPQKGELPKERMTLGMVSTKSYRKVRGDLESLLEHLYINKVKINQELQKEIEESNKLVQQGTVTIKDGNDILGKVMILEDHKIALELDLAILTELAKKHPTYHPLLNTSPIIEDLTFSLPLDTQVGKVLEIIESSDPLVKEAALIDNYQQNYSFRITYQHPEENLSNELVTPIRQKIVQLVEKEIQAKLVGKV